MQVVELRANNPSIFTGPGTNTYVVVSAGQAIVIDPGPDSPAEVYRDHMEALRDALGPWTPVGVLVTHVHPDHAPAANPLAAELEVPAYGHGAGPSFRPDVTLGDGSVLEFGDTAVTAVHTPGHTPDHLCFQVDDVLFTGDHIMGGSTVIIEDAGAYLLSLEKLKGRSLARLYPGHGPIIDEPDRVIEQNIAHRRMRELQIIEAIRGGATDVVAIVAAVYADVEASRHFAAAMQVRTQLAKLAADGRVSWRPDRAGGDPVHLVEEGTE